MKERCVNIDWLEVYCLESRQYYPCNAEFFRSHGWSVRERDYGTRVYAEMFTLLDIHDEPIIEIRRKPLSDQSRDGGLFPAESCHIRLTNAACYMPSPVNLLREFLSRYDYEFRKIFRLDVCLDFERFDRGDDPQAFMQRYVAGRYSKINQARIAAHGQDLWRGRDWNSLSWGQPKSMVGTKFYCKSLELAQVKDKPYIRYAWFESHLIDDPVQMTKRGSDGKPYKPVIWRVEFSIKSSAQKWFIIEKSMGKKGSIPMPHSLSMYDTPQKLLTIFASLAQHYFHFKLYEDGKRKDRCPDKVLFDFSPLDTFYKVDRIASHKPQSSPLQRLLVAIQNYQLSTLSMPARKACDVIIEDIRRLLLNESLSSHSDREQILLLQRLISERLHGTAQPSLEEHAREIRELIANYKTLF